MVIFHDPRCAEYVAAGHPERPARVVRSAAFLREAHPGWEWRVPNEASDEALTRAHTTAHVERVRAAPHDFDADTPAYEGVFGHAARAAGAACAVAQLSLGGEKAVFHAVPPALKV
ncbi:MAG: histone deacetylase, partial [Chthoniobacterales bacterium]